MRLFTIQEILYFYNLDVNSYLTKFLEDIQADLHGYLSFSLL